MYCSRAISIQTQYDQVAQGVAAVHTEWRHRPHIVHAFQFDQKDGLAAKLERVFLVCLGDVPIPTQ